MFVMQLLQKSYFSWGICLKTRVRRQKIAFPGFRAPNVSRTPQSGSCMASPLTVLPPNISPLATPLLIVGICNTGLQTFKNISRSYVNCTLYTTV